MKKCIFEFNKTKFLTMKKVHQTKLSIDKLTISKLNNLQVIKAGSYTNISHVRTIDPKEDY